MMRGRIGPLLAIGSAWSLACTQAWLGTGVAATSGFVAVALLPGYFADRALAVGAVTGAQRFEGLARALTSSVAIVAVLGLLCSSLGLAIGPLLTMLLTTTIALALTAGPTPVAGADRRARPTDPTTALFIAMCIVAAAMALGADNIARDRMWYLAYVERLASGEALTWREPVFGTGRVLARFAHNGWLLVLAAWKALAGVRGALVFERIGPPLFTLCVGSAALALARPLFGAGPRAAAVAATSLLVLLSTRYPFFSPDRYPFFGRLAEDKTIALLVLAPVALGLFADLLGARTRDRTRIAVALLLALVATASSHVLVYLLVAIALASCAAATVTWVDRAAWKPAAAVVAMLVVVGAAPGLSGFAARRQVVAEPAPRASMAAAPAHPVVRSHLRMQRLHEVSAGGPIVDPRLIAEPLLVLSLLGIVLAAFARRTIAGAFVLAMSLPMLALAFVPWLSPLWGRLVLPWMAYRALWGVPFGLALGTVLVTATRVLRPPAASARGPAIVLTICVLALAWNRLPLERLAGGDGDRPGLLPDAATVELLDEIARLPAGIRVAAAPALAELIPAYSGRTILAFSDRGSVVFAGSRAVAERRMQANAALIGLHGGSARLRNRLVGRYDVTHTVYEGRSCDRQAATIFRNSRFSLCAERSQRAGAGLARTTAVGTADGRGTTVAALAAGLDCRPRPEPHHDGEVLRWRRRHRWSGVPVAVACRARFDEPAGVAWLRVVAHLPRAHEALVYRIAVTTPTGKVLRRQGALELRDNPYGEIRLPALRATRVRLRLVPAYLPFLNLRALELRG